MTTDIDSSVDFGTEVGVRSIEELEALLRPVMKATAAAVGRHCEVVLHDVSRSDVGRTIVAIENGHVTGREVGGPSTNLGLEFLRQQEGEHDEYGYRTRTRDGRELRSSSVYFRDTGGQLLGILCLNIDMTPLQAAALALHEVLRTEADDAPERTEIFATDIKEVLENLIERAIASTGKTVALMGREDKIASLRYLDSKGAFFIKRAVVRVSQRLKISRGATYNYLEQIRSKGD